MRTLRRYALVLSVYLNTRGFAFILFEGHLSPFDWGIRETRGPQKSRVCLIRIKTVFDRYAPDALVIQDTSEQGTQRARRIRNLNALIVKLANDRGTRVFAYSRDQVRRAFEGYGCPNKQSLAELIAKHIPAFQQYVPPPRKPWMSEDRRMGLFDAAAQGLVFFQE
ncbi:Holliday junction resolvasome RuvABC endonuclease subunit [Bradyrhizobium sp. USDA 3311]